LGTAGVAYGLWRARRARYEASMARSQRLWAMLLDQAHDPIFYLDTDGAIREVNSRAAEVYGYSREEMRRLRIHDLHPPEAPGTVERAMSEVRAAGGAVLQLTHRRRDGEEFPVEVSSRFVDLGDEQFFLSIARDMTQRRREDEQKRWLLRVIEQSPASIVITDTLGCIQYVNPRFTAVSGYEPYEVLGLNPRVLKSGQTPPEVYRELWTRITAGEEWHGEMLNRRKDGTVFWEEARISGVRDPQGRVTHYVAVKEDITARKEAERALRAAQDQLLQSQKMEAIGKLAGGVAHDFNNLLGVILGYAEMLARSFDAGDARRHRVEQIEKASQRAAALTRQLLA
ncbi:MAG TPA: PAS domain S-box protein, partial [Vicinamibacteria bacterium]|nr:PAS domain S-box protein [Vicinamibacteria bacterium]